MTPASQRARWLMNAIFNHFSGGIFCGGLANTCGIAGTVSQQGHSYVITHHTTANNGGETGYKLAFLQLPCNSNHDVL